VLQVLPLALGAAVSPTAFVVELLILSSRTSPRAKAWAYLLGFATVLVAAVVLFLTVLSRAADADGGGHTTTGRIVDGLAALLLAGVGIRSLMPKATPGEKHTSKVATRIGEAGPGFYVGVGAVTMLINFSTLILLAPACHEITRSMASSGVKAFCAVMLVVVTLLPVLLPVLGVTVLGSRADAVLARINSFVSRHSRQINAAVCLVLAALLAWKAIR
jgi:threonine/homoserine/homoserine lactone efflux protein